MPRRRARLVAALAIALGLGPALGLASFGGSTAVAADPAALELEIDSTISITSLSSAPVDDGKARVIGRIPLTATGGGTFAGSGTLESTTTSGPTAGCNTAHVEGRGTYDWVVRSASLGNGSGDIVVHMDSGPINEAPDTVDLDACATVLHSTINAWENLFFQVHMRDYRAMGFEVRGWTMEEGGLGFADGDLVATAVWSGKCPQEVISACEAETTFRLFAVGGSTATPPVTPETPNGATPSPVPTTGAGGGLVVRMLDAAGDPIAGACLELRAEAAGPAIAGSLRCDGGGEGLAAENDGFADGSIGWSGLAPGSYVVAETRQPGDAHYETLQPAPATIAAGAVTRLDLARYRTGALTLTKLDPAGQPLPGACFALQVPGGIATFLCDGPDIGTAGPGDGTADGILVLIPSAAREGGTYELTEIRPPDGYAAAAVQQVELSEKSATRLSVTDTTGAARAIELQPTPAPAATAAPTGPAAALACTDLESCIGSYWPVAAGGIVLLGIVVIIGLKVLGGSTVVPLPQPSPEPLPGSSLDYDKLEYDKLTEGSLDYDKLEYDKLEGSLEATAPLEPTSPLSDAPGSTLEYDKLTYDKLTLDGADLGLDGGTLNEPLPGSELPWK